MQASRTAVSADQGPLLVDDEQVDCTRLCLKHCSIGVLVSH